MKKILNILAGMALAVTALSCAKLDLESKGIIDESVLMSSDAGVATYFVKLYNELPIEDFLYAAAGPECGYATNNAKGKHTGNVWETNKYWSGQLCRECYSSHMVDVAYSEAFGYWPYDDIREVNNFIEKFPSYKSKFTEELYEQYMAEARFLRAFFYFGLVKRYGGVPIITTVQDPTAPLEELEVARDKEYDCWKFIHSDLEYAMEHLSSNKTQVYRANRYAAAALMSKAMLYAASVANYNHTVGINGEATSLGIMGMAQTYAEEFYQYAYDACKVIEEAGYSLHQGADKTKAYREIFIENLAGEEDIFTKAYDRAEMNAEFKTGLTHHWDARILPVGRGLSSQVGTAMNPYWDLISLYEHPAIVDGSGRPVRFDSLSDFWESEELEPRCRANFLFPDMTEPASGTVIDILAGVYSTFPGTAADACPDPNVENEYTIKYRKIEPSVGVSRKIGAKADGTIVENYSDSDASVTNKYGMIKISGDHGCLRSAAEFSASYATVIYKHVDYSCDPQTRVYFGSHQPWKVFRYGEILLNQAEAAYELSLLKNDSALRDEAYELVNRIRERAGAQPHTFAASPTDVGTPLYGFRIDENLQFIRDERRRELCFENQLNWDERRWRVRDAIYQNWTGRCLMDYKVLDEDKYIFLAETDIFNRRITYFKRFYYDDIPGTEIAKNSKLIHNDGY